MPYSNDSHRRIGARHTIGRIALLTSVCAFAFGMALSLPASLSSDGFTLVSAQAAGNGNGNGNGKGPGEAPGQLKQEDSAAADNEAIDSVEGYAESGVAESGESTPEETIIPIAEDQADAEKKVVKEVAGLDDEAELSEEEELEAIRSGWGTWRTADGPDTVTAQ